MNCEQRGLPVVDRALGHVFFEDCIAAHNVRYQDLVDAVEQMKRNAAEAADKLYQYAPGYFPAGDEERGETAPFFSKTYQYNLMGKEDGRTVLSLVHHLLEAAGFDRYDIHAFEEKAARANERRENNHA